MPIIRDILRKHLLPRRPKFRAQEEYERKLDITGVKEAEIYPGGNMEVTTFSGEKKSYTDMEEIYLKKCKSVFVDYDMEGLYVECNNGRVYVLYEEGGEVGVELEDTP